MERRALKETEQKEESAFLSSASHVSDPGPDLFMTFGHLNEE